jgi:hypothetical protein
MPRATYGPRVKARTKRVLELLLRYANQELDLDVPLDVPCRWQDDTPDAPTLVVQTSLRAIQEIGQHLHPDAPLTKGQIRESLRRLEDFLGWLEDYRVHQRGTEAWHFALHLPAKETKAVLAAADQQWEALRSPKSDPEASAQGDKNDTESENPPHPSGLITGVPFQAPPLPLYFVERPEPCQAVKAYLLEHTPQRTGTLVVSAIQGLGGIGKSVLAAALAHDIEVQTRFCDGILWTTLGQQPDILSSLSGWIQDLGDHSYKPTTPASASAHLRTLLHDKRMLLVVDDVWDPSHADPFRVGGSDCCVLVTTREARLQGCLRYDLDVMTPEQALALLSHAIQEDLAETAIQQALELAKAVAYLPLALELAAAQIEDGATWTELLEALQQEIADLDVLDIQGFGFQSQGSKQRNLSLLASFNLSLKRLPPEQLTQFAWLGVLPEDITLTETMAATLWEMKPPQARTLLRFFKSRALLLSGSRQLDQTLGYRLHDLMHDVARHLLVSDPQVSQPGTLPGLGLTLPQAHQALLERYRRKLQQGLWHTIPSDGYIHAHLTWHLEQAERVDEIHQLLQETTPNGKNGWYQACQELGQVAGFISDIARGWRLAETHFAEAPAKSLGLQCRYALMKGSLNTLMGTIPPELIAVLVSEGIWQPAQGLAHLQQVPKPWRQVYIFKFLLPHIPDSLLTETLQIVRSIRDQRRRSEMLINLSRRMPELRAEALQRVHTIPEDFQRAISLGYVATYKPHLWPQVLNEVKGSRPERDQGSILRELVEIMPEDVLNDAWQMTTTIQDPYARAIGMAAIASLNPAFIKEALASSLETARQIKNVYRRAWSLSALATLDAALWPEAIAEIRKIEHEFAQARLIKNLAPDFPPDVVSVMIDIGRAIQDERRRVIALGALSVRKPALWPEVLADTQLIRDGDRLVKALVGLSTRVEMVGTMALTMTESIEPDYEQAMAYTALAERQPQWWPKAREATFAIQNACYRAVAFNELATEMPEIWPHALEASRSFQHAFDRAQLLSDLACKMPQLWPETIDAIGELWFERQQSQLIYRAILDVPTDVLPDLATLVEGIRDEFERLLALSALAIRMPEKRPEALNMLDGLKLQAEYPDHQAVVAMALGAFAIFEHISWAEVLTVIQGIQDENWRAQVVQNMATLFPQDLLLEVVTLIFQIQAEYYRAYALLEVLPRLDLSEQPHPQWGEMLQTLASLFREEMLELMPALADSIFALGGEAAIVEVAQAIRDVGQQW